MGNFPHTAQAWNRITTAIEGIIHLYRQSLARYLDNLACKVDPGNTSNRIVLAMCLERNEAHVKKLHAAIFPIQEKLHKHGQLLDDADGNMRLWGHADSGKSIHFTGVTLQELLELKRL